MTSIVVAEGNPVYHSDGNCLIETASKTLIAGCNNSIIPVDGSVTSIGEFAFSYCPELTSVFIPDSMTSIDNSIFAGCNNLTSIVIPDSVTSINEYALTGCPALTSIFFEGTMEQWYTIVLPESTWDLYPPADEVVCSDGTLLLK